MSDIERHAHGETRTAGQPRGHGLDQPPVAHAIAVPAQEGRDRGAIGRQRARLPVDRKHELRRGVKNRPAIVGDRDVEAMMADQGIVQVAGQGGKVLGAAHVGDSPAQQHQLAADLHPVLLLEMHLYRRGEPGAAGDQDDRQDREKQEIQAQRDRGRTFHAASGNSIT